VTGPPAPPPRYGRLYWALLPAGGLLMAWGLVGLFRDASSTVPASWLRWFLGGLLVHDLLVVPAVLAVGLAVRRLPPALQPPVRTALIVSGTLALMSVPLLLGYGRSTQPGNASVLPGDYPRDLGMTVGGVWAAAAIWALLGLLGRR
jgi:hypothetical protein